MKLSASLILIGFRGVGKSTLARALAEKFSCAWNDSDDFIAQKTGKSIATLFAERGEEFFRDQEEAAITEILSTQLSTSLKSLNAPQILSTGGGAILRATTRARLRQAGIVIWLTASEETIFQRLTENSQSESNVLQESRPALTSLSLREEIATLLAARAPLYAETAHHQIATDDKTIDEITQEGEKLIDYRQWQAE